ncbi:MAG: BamA/TamA family outer membrane protein [Saprospiraceae bacterium]|nr:BamA/TamA family outer membrane protein [Saprospiraceae bacterium]
MSLFFISCNSTKYLQPNESLLKESNLEFRSESVIKDKKNLLKEVSALIEQKPNAKLLFFIPKEWIYLRNSENADSTFFKRWLKGLGEPPTIYDEKITTLTATKIQNLLQNKRGFYNAEVVPKITNTSKVSGWENTTEKSVWLKNESRVTYVINAGSRFIVRNVNYLSPDSAIVTFLDSGRQNAFVKPGDPIDFTQFELEKSRIVLELQNQGYANFANNYIEIRGDSSNARKDVDIYFDILRPLPDTSHQRFYTGNIKVYTDYHKDQEKMEIVSDTLLGLNLMRQSQNYLVKPSVLRNSIFMRSGHLLRREDRLKTFRKLNSLGTYRFVTMYPEISSDADSVMNFNVLLTPYQYKWIYDGGLEGYFSTLGASRLFGFSLSTSFQNRNLFGGSERFTIRGELGFELGFSKGESGFLFTQRARNFSIQNNLQLPSFLDFVGLGKLVSGIGLVKKKFYNAFKDETTTNIALGYSANNIINFYSINSVNASFGFDYTAASGNRYIFRPLGFNFDRYTIADSSRFQSNPLIFLQFRDILGTGFVFRDFSFIYNGKKSASGRSYVFINNLEFSGMEIFLLNKLYNSISGSSEEWKLNFDGRESEKAISFAKYVRLELDGRISQEFSKTRSLVGRLNVGIINPFGIDNVAPFVKQFGVGGPNSLRAWNIKELGPGGYIDPLQKINQRSNIFIQQGDVKIEANLEYRFNIFSFFDGAFFADAGNVWALRADPERKDAEISSKFLDQIALNIGYGVRVNFQFFIIRFDAGYKIRSPYRDNYTQRNWYTFKEIRQQGLGNIQVAVNYPF